jgi:hypothetical protein
MQALEGKTCAARVESIEVGGDAVVVGRGSFDGRLFE